MNELGPYLDKYPILYNSRPPIMMDVKKAVDFGLKRPETITSGISHERCSTLLPWTLYAQLNSYQSL